MDEKQIKQQIESSGDIIRNDIEEIENKAYENKLRKYRDELNGMYDKYKMKLAQHYGIIKELKPIEIKTNKEVKYFLAIKCCRPRLNNAKIEEVINISKKYPVSICDNIQIITVANTLYTRRPRTTELIWTNYKLHFYDTYDIWTKDEQETQEVNVRLTSPTICDLPNPKYEEKFNILEKRIRDLEMKINRLTH